MACGGNFDQCGLTACKIDILFEDDFYSQEPSGTRIGARKSFAERTDRGANKVKGRFSPREATFFFVKIMCCTWDVFGRG